MLKDYLDEFINLSSIDTHLRKGIVCVKCNVIIQTHYGLKPVT